MKQVMMLMLMLGIAACGSRQEGGLEWPAVKALDHEVEELDGLLAAEEPDEAALSEHVPHVQEALAALFASEVPAGTAHPEMVRQKLEELRALAADVGQVPEVLPGLHPLVASLMEAAGMPHVHDEHEHGHGHEGWHEGGHEDGHEDGDDGHGH